ncbi:MAG: DUF4157 domain-containing protein [Oscillospiraceae bacterium]|nr:DUF4157 domain-containing protein [Oscillospiraceae bacterium]
MRVYEKREEQRLTQTTQRGGPGAGFAAHGVPNSAVMPLNGLSETSGYALPDLEQRMQARLSRVRERPQAQIPQAAQEADRLSAAVQSGTPESVKAAMGRRMGADFSGVRFHTGAAAAAKADGMGARAYTSGADIYFGTEGFDPSVAAHELVHTAQQGIVDSGAATVAAPAGGVQMMENPLKKAWRKTGGRAIRKHHDAMSEFAKARKTSKGGSGDWAKLSKKTK